MRIPKTLVLAFLLFALPTCSPRDFLTRRLAADLISGSQLFNAPQVLWLHTGPVSNRDFNSPESLVLQRRGWITATDTKCPPGIEPPPCWDVVLSPAGVGTFQPLIGPSAGNPVAVRMARRELIDITGISKAGNFADVEFTWRWKPMNEVGIALNESGIYYRSTVAFRNYDDGWRIAAEPIRSNQSLDDALRNAQSSAP